MTEVTGRGGGRERGRKRQMVKGKIKGMKDGANRGGKKRKRRYIVSKETTREDRYSQ